MSFVNMDFVLIPFEQHLDLVMLSGVTVREGKGEKPHGFKAFGGEAQTFAGVGPEGI